ncbi:MAG: hypothetical protein R3D45_05890 [Rhizobiaceae bacterium]
MYVRFVSPLVDPGTRAETGFFQSVSYLRQNEAPRWILDELENQFEWFGEHLPLPERLGWKFKRRRAIWGTSWFVPSFQEGVSRARYCAWLFEEAGLPVRAIKIARPQEIIWRDSFQILIKPTATTPRAFR